MTFQDRNEPRRRRRFKQTEPLEQRLAKEAQRLRDEARLLPSGLAREHTLRKARQAETAARMTEWLRSLERAPLK